MSPDSWAAMRIAVAAAYSGMALGAAGAERRWFLPKWPPAHAVEAFGVIDDDLRQAHIRHRYGLTSRMPLVPLIETITAIRERLNARTRMAVDLELPTPAE